MAALTQKLIALINFKPVDEVVPDEFFIQQVGGLHQISRKLRIAMNQVIGGRASLEDQEAIVSQVRSDVTAFREVGGLTDPRSLKHGHDYLEQSLEGKLR